MKKEKYLTLLLVMLLMALFYMARPINAADKSKESFVANQAVEWSYTVDELIDIAENCRKSGNTAGLVSALKSWAAQDPNRFDARLELGTIYVSQNKFSDAIRILGEASSIIPSDEAPHRLLARIYKGMGIDSLYGYHLVRAAYLAQRNWENQYNLAMYNISKGKIAQAEKLLAKAIELNGANALSKFEYAKIMLDKKDLEAAFRNFDDALLIEPKNARCRAYCAYTAKLSGRHTVAKENIEIALKDAPQDATVLYMAGLVNINDGDIKAAEQYLRVALRYSPTDVLAIEALGDVLAANFKYKEACASYMKVWEIAGFNERVAYKLGKTLSYDKKQREAKDFLEAVAAKNPKNGDVVYCLTDVYYELGDMKRVKSMAERFGSGANAVWYKAVQGRIYEATSVPDLAEMAYFAAYRIDSRNAAVNAGLGRLMYNRGEFDSAAIFLETAVALEPADMRNLVYKAKVFEKKGDIKGALDVYESVIARSPQHPEIYLSVASIKREQGDTRGAIKSVNQGLEVNPSDANLLLLLGNLYKTARQYELAVNAYQAVVGRKVSESNVEVLRVIGDIYYSNLTNEKKAKEFFKKYVRAGGKDSVVDDIIRKLNNKDKT